MKALLIVEDSKSIRTAIRRILEPLGFQVSEAADGEEVLAHCTNNGLPDGILLDIDRPVMDGITFLKAIRQNQSYDGASVIMCTTHNSLEKITEAMEAGANEYVMKPFDEDIIRGKLEAGDFSDEFNPKTHPRDGGGRLRRHPGPAHKAYQKRTGYVRQRDVFERTIRPDRPADESDRRGPSGH